MTASRLTLWPPLPPGVYARRRSTDLPFPLGAKGCSLFARGRHALWEGVRFLGVEPGDEILVPAYHCGSEIEALAGAGLICTFYEAGETLQPDDGELESLLTPRSRALFLIHYYGFPQDAPRWRRWCDERGLLLIEDCAQAWLASHDGRPLGSFGDLAIFSLYKTFGVPDGAALVSTGQARGSRAAGRLGLVPVGKKHVSWLMTRSERLDAFLSRFEHEEVEDFSLGEPANPSFATRFLLPRVARPDAAARRRANYRILLDEFVEHVPPPFARLPEEACPLVFPLEVGGRPGLRERLEREGIEARRFWPFLHPLFPARDFPGAVSWHDRFLALPVHQELREGEVGREAAGIRRALASRAP
ncbi:MAG TPA: DegT/DnrJ/EryC1/StrS family aminotransferase [Gaiellaceae bacterium]|nr:DegT/DnrJ/EryC1/StrS family aminotransferase [Gaiellaceae bacterium]